MHDAEHGVDGVWIGCLVNGAGARSRIPLGAEISPLHEPLAGAISYAHVRVRIGECRRYKIDIELEFSVLLRAHKPGVAVLQHLEEIGVRRIHPDGNISDRDYHAVTLDLCG